MDRYICIHGHFYQPPRENAWLEFVELQDSAYPFHDWNERITAECYAPNGMSRILDGFQNIEKIANNYARISFNFGPTLLAWMADHEPESYQAILDADKESRERFSGHGSAIAQAYNHTILPLSNSRDKYTQILWGIRDFESRFGRKPEGMWLPEAAVDSLTLGLLAEQGIKFTVLAPRSAWRVRKLGGRKWKEVSGGGIDPSRAYLCRLAPGRSIALFFYDGPISQAVAFEGLLQQGEQFAARLASGFSGHRNWPQLVHIATDGETYGHHHAHGDMALAAALNHVESSGIARLTNYGEFLEKHPPTHEVQIAENSSWSCSHGVERWKADCGCNSGGRADWDQAWRAPLRRALDWLRDELGGRFEQRARELLRDPWVARDAYIEAVLDRSPESISQFLARHAQREIAEPEVVSALKLLEMQRHLMLMYTSCGWFFDEISGLESMKVLEYAGRALQLAREIFTDEDLEPRFIDLLADARSNVAEHADAAQLYRKFVQPAMIDLPKVGAHYAISCMYLPGEDRSRIFCYEIERRDYRRLRSGAAALDAGAMRVRSLITRETAELAFAVLHLGDHHVHAGIRRLTENESANGTAELIERFEKGDFGEALRLLEEKSPGERYSLRSLFRDQQRAIIERLLHTTLAESRQDYRRIYDKQAPHMRFVADMGVPQPPVFHITAEFVLNAELRQALRAPEPDLVRVALLLEAARRDQVRLDPAEAGHAMKNALERMMARLQYRSDLNQLRALNAALELARLLPFPVSLWSVQNRYFQMLSQGQLEAPKDEAEVWQREFAALGERLKIRVPAAERGQQLQPEAPVAA